MARHEFPRALGEALARRVAHLCSNPGCRQSTTGPHSDQSKAINVGVAAHITAASPGGPRFDPSLTEEQRTSAVNGIWLCQLCGKLVDTDAVRYTVVLLRRWKVEAEARALAALTGQEVPSAATALAQKGLESEAASSLPEGNAHEDEHRATTDTATAGDQPQSLPELPTVLVCAMAIRDLRRLKHYYPTAITDADYLALLSPLNSKMKYFLSLPEYKGFDEFYADQLAADAGPYDDVTVLIAGLAMNLAELPTDRDHTEDVVRKSVILAFRRAQENATDPVRTLAQRVVELRMLDCRVPHPHSQPEYDDPRRYLQMLRAYWEFIKQSVLHVMDAPMGWTPYPLLPLTINFRERMRICFNKLAFLDGASEARQKCDSLVEILLSGEPDELSVVPEWTNGEVTHIERWLAEARLTVGSGSFTMTAEEELALEQSQHSLAWLKQRTQETWARVMKRAERQAGRFRSDSQTAER